MTGCSGLTQDDRCSGFAHGATGGGARYLAYHELQIRNRQLAEQDTSILRVCWAVGQVATFWFDCEGWFVARVTICWAGKVTWLN